MTPEDFCAWRRRMGWKKNRAASELGIGVRTLDYYEAGARHDGQPVTIPRHIALACAALAFGLPPYRDGERPAP